MTTRRRPARFPAEYGPAEYGPAEYGAPDSPADSPADTPPEDTSEAERHLQDWTEVAARISAAPNYFLATTDDDGRPHLRPVDGVFVDDALCFGGSPETRWVRYLQQRPDISMSLPDAEHAVLLEGAAELVTDATLPVSIALGPANRAKYPQYYTGDDAPPFRPFWCLRPRRVYAWSLSEFPARATRFDLG